MNYFSFFNSTVLMGLCCCLTWLAISATLALAEVDDFDLRYDQLPYSQMQITKDGRQVLFEPSYDRAAYFPQTSQSVQTPYYLYNKPDFPANTYSPTPQYLGKTPATPPEGARRGMFQGASVTASYLPGWGSHGLSMTQLRFGATFAMPAPLEDSFILLAPSFEPTFVKWGGPEPFPDTLYSVSLSCTLIKKLNDRWSAMASVGPRWSSDGKETKHSVRCSLLGGLTWNHSRQWHFRFGVVYLNRADSFNILPFGGAIWTPNDDWKIELMAPMLRVARRCEYFQNVFSRDNGTTHWGYAGIGFSGGTWAIRSVGNQPDVANYSEFSVLIGLESKRQERTPWKAELGYVFARNMNFERNTLRKFSIDDTIVLRVTLAI